MVVVPEHAYAAVVLRMCTEQQHHRGGVWLSKK